MPPARTLSQLEAANRVRDWIADKIAYEPDATTVSILRELYRACDPARRQIIANDRRAA